MHLVQTERMPTTAAEGYFEKVDREAEPMREEVRCSRTKMMLCPGYGP